MKEPAIDNKELILALEELEKEKGIKKDYLLDSIETALLTAYRRNYNSQENVKVVVDRETGASHLYAVKEVVEYVEKPVLQIMGGKLDAYAKVMGVKKAKRTMLDAIQHELENKFKNYSKDELDFAVAYTYDEEASIEWQKEVEEKFGVTNTIRNPLSLSVSTHIGPGALAIAVSRKIN